MSLALVTGASGGIGAALAAELAAHGHDLVLVARSLEPMERLGAGLRQRHGVDYWPMSLDLTAPGAVQQVVDELDRAGLSVDVLVNNAGFAGYGPFAESDPGTQEGMIALNVTVPTLLTRAFLPGMVERGRGRILMVASTAAFLPGPGMALYYATKAFVLSLADSVGEELRGSGVTVTALCPGPVASGFQERAGMQASRLLTQRGNPVADPAAVARAGVEGLLQGRALVVPGLANRAVVTLPRLLPRRLLARVVARAQAPVT